ncbi:MAG: ABC transporter ATP-binding protein [Candidatus Sumerlaeia bacterium]|nr:ABC transporter ATP-binding protein [Candidatus Sumerlaeia bacterium]
MTIKNLRRNILSVSSHAGNPAARWTFLGDNLVQLVDVHHAYAGDQEGDSWVLCGIDLTVRAGEFVAIHGRSDTGKSTLLHILGGILAPRRGHVLIGGRDLFQMSDRALSHFRNRTLGFIFQNYYLAPSLTALENVMVPALLSGEPVHRARHRALDALEQVGLAAKAKACPADLSGGQMQRVAIARALVNRPTLLLADEPTGNLDEQTGGAIMDLLASYQRERGLTILMATHDPSVELHATSQLYLVGGKLQAGSAVVESAASGRAAPENFHPSAARQKEA